MGLLLCYVISQISKLYGKIARKNESYKFLVGVSKIIWGCAQIAFTINYVDIEESASFYPPYIEKKVVYPELYKDEKINN